MKEHGRGHLRAIRRCQSGVESTIHETIHFSNGCLLLFLLLKFNFLVSFSFPSVIFLADESFDLYPVNIVMFMKSKSRSRAVANFLVRLATPILAAGSQKNPRCFPRSVLFFLSAVILETRGQGLGCSCCRFDEFSLLINQGGQLFFGSQNFLGSEGRGVWGTLR